MINHNNLAETCKGGVSLTDCLGPNELEVLWVPQYHGKFPATDSFPYMGLVTGFMGATYSGTPLVMASLLDFIANPLLWTDMVEKYQATITSAPNFAYALLLKRLKQVNRTADWSCVKRAMFGGEPAQIEPCCGGSVKNASKPDSEGLVCCGEVNSPTLKLRIVQDGQEVEDGQVGSIWAQSPRVAVGYYGQAELTKATFANSLPGYEGSWLETVKDVIIVNGKNYYPTDEELSIDEVFGDVIRPGRTSAFQLGEDSIGVTLEAQNGFDKSANKDLAIKVSNHVSCVHGLFVGEVVILKLGVTPKTTSGKLKRSEIRQKTIAGDWKESSVLLLSKRHCNTVPVRGQADENLAALPCGIAQNQTYQASGLPARTDKTLTSHQDSTLPSCVVACGATDSDCFSTRYANTITSVLGSEVVTSKTWAENGLTSLKSAELRNKVEETLHVVLPANFEQLYTTSTELSAFLEASESKSFAKQDLYNNPDFLRNSSGFRLSKLQLALVQTVGLLAIILLLFASAVPSYFLVNWVLGHSDTKEKEERGGPVSWVLLPLAFPLFILSFSVIVVLCKIVVVRKYQSQQFELLSWDYVFVIGENCHVAGMISPGAKIGDGSKVETLSVIEEGVIVPEGVLARGNPAYNAGPFKHPEPTHVEDSMLDALKILWTLFEAYHFFAISYLVHLLLNNVLPAWQYSTILHWFVWYPVASFLALVTSILLKWVLIGKRDPSDAHEDSLYRRATNWACDFHFRIASWALTIVFGHSKISNLIPFLHGLDVDFVSELHFKPQSSLFSPSKVDYIKIRKSFLPNISLDLSSKKAVSKVEIINSSVGYNVHLHAGVTIMGSMIPPRSTVSESIYDLNAAGQAFKPKLTGLLLIEGTQQLMNVVVFVSLIPAYEIGLMATKSSSLLIVGMGLAATFIMQLLVWLLMAGVVESVLLTSPHSLQQCTIVDSSYVMAHYVDRNGVTIDDTYVSGILHPGCYASAGAVVHGPESCPMKVLLRPGVGTKCQFQDAMAPSTKKKGGHVVADEESCLLDI
ncbi:unknown protein [Seminavis robusta]|uniref:Uncharacterized protein n=1 Tax=Seminavis robusta TaxID=568900 RepID=A0A9N8EW81_9STRA|nr:unknown protein [Seminavis robusta]|eukprot:Sro1945_g306990.1 n/a (1031) ;mRNA; r:16248-19934